MTFMPLLNVGNKNDNWHNGKELNDIFSQRICGLDIEVWWRKNASVNQATTSSYNGLSPVRRQNITEINSDLLTELQSGTNSSDIWIIIQSLSLKRINFNLTSAKCRPFCLCLNMLGSTPVTSRLHGFILELYKTDIYLNAPSRGITLFFNMALLRSNKE